MKFKLKVLSYPLLLRALVSLFAFAMGSNAFAQTPTELSDSDKTVLSTASSSDVLTHFLQTQSIADYQNKAEQGDALAQLIVGLAYVNDETVPVDESKTKVLFEQSCAQGLLRACFNLGYIHAYGSEVHRDETLATALFKTACEGGNAKGCYEYGTALFYGNGTSENVAESTRAYKESCDMGLGDGCYQYGVSLRWARGVGQDFFKAAKAFQLACDQNISGGCSDLGVRYKNGEGVEQNFERAHELYEKACDLNDMMGCNNLGVLYAEGSGVPQDYEKASALYEKSCDGDTAFGCRNLAFFFEEGRLGSIDLDKAESYFQKSCDLGDATGCERLEAIQIRTRVISPEDLSKARDAYFAAVDYFENGRFNHAEDSLLLATRLRGTKDAFFSALDVKIKHKQKDYDGAETAYLEFEKFDPSEAQIAALKPAMDDVRSFLGKQREIDEKRKLIEDPVTSQEIRTYLTVVGRNGDNGSGAAYQGDYGRDGDDGQRPSKEIELFIVSKREFDHIKPVGRLYLPGLNKPRLLGDWDFNQNLKIKSIGGDGGYGGNGSYGFGGKHGANTIMRIIPPTPGQDGTRGGNGGDGGSGGTIIVHVVGSEKFFKDVSAAVQADVSGGSGGNGGYGAPGGIGGSSYDRRYKAANGRKGADGRRGRRGDKGQFTIKSMSTSALEARIPSLASR